MNKPLLSILRLLVISMAFSLGCLNAKADELIFIDNNFNTATDQPELIPADQKGSVSWNAETKTLTLKSVRISTQSKVLSGWLNDEITLQVEGDNSIACIGDESAISMRSAMRITGSGTLSISTTGYAAVSCSGGLTIADGVAIVAVGAVSGISGDWVSPLTIDNAYISASTLPDSPIARVSIGYFSAINLKNCEIVSPDGANVGTINGAASITVDGEVESIDPIVIAPKKEYAKVTIAEDPHGKVMAPSGIDLQHVLVGTPIGFTVEPDPGYALTKLMAGTEDILNTQILVVKKDVTVTPTFTSSKAHKVTLVEPEHGTLTVQETGYDLNQVPDGTILHFVCIPDDGYELQSLKAGDVDITANMYVEVTSSVEIKADYKLIPVPEYKVKIVVLGYGEVKADYKDLDAVPNGTTIHLTCTPDTKDDHLESLSVNGEDIMETKSFVIEGLDARVEAVFKRDVHPAVDAPSDGSTYSISISEETLSIEGASEGMPIYIRTIFGETLIQTMATGCDDIDLSAIPAGVYLLSVGNASYKLYL